MSKGDSSLPTPSGEQCTREELAEILAYTKAMWGALAAVAMRVPNAEAIVGPRAKLPGTIDMVFEQAASAVEYKARAERAEIAQVEHARKGCAVSEKREIAPPTEGEIAVYRNVFREELDKNMKNSSGSPSTDAHRVALHNFVRTRNGRHA